MSTTKTPKKMKTITTSKTASAVSGKPVAVRKPQASKSTIVRKQPAKKSSSVAKPALRTKSPAQPNTQKAVKNAVPLKTPPAAAKIKLSNNTKEDGKKIKLVRGSYSMPENEYAALGVAKKACLKAGFEIKKSELLRIGVSLVSEMNSGNLKLALARLTPSESGHSKKKK